MEYLEKEASLLFYEITRFSFHIGEISWTHYLDRMQALKDMTETGDPIGNHAKRILLAEEWNTETGWTYESTEEENSAGNRWNNGEIKSGISEDKNNYFQFLSQKKGLTDWLFHQYDKDFHPSIPHGHFQGQKKPKLDAYLGWIYDGSIQIERLPRKMIIDLWNDEAFRVFAHISIKWYRNEFRSFTWRVQYPLRLPKRR